MQTRHWLRGGSPILQASAAATTLPAAAVRRSCRYCSSGVPAGRASLALPSRCATVLLDASLRLSLQHWPLGPSREQTSGICSGIALWPRPAHLPTAAWEHVQAAL
ncbi:hypothetical protein NDU88_006586 [Pleurodeles waltl]|uniref:Uncharacterized protein n=1 Tax=Pleurodeles waltl TaxID=8319 RepID=A0AAV7X466_PLEWA|nr:hypothetical protein NDU88_006586 [Pleurodeles waltl]